VFRWGEVAWNQLGQDTSGGQDVTISSDGKVIVVCLPSSASPDFTENECYVQAYQWSVDTSSWEQLGSEVFAGCNRVGSSVAMSSGGSYVAFGNSGFVSIVSLATESPRRKLLIAIAMTNMCSYSFLLTCCQGPMRTRPKYLQTKVKITRTIVNNL
jgi:hypothetical protein